MSTGETGGEARPAGFSITVYAVEERPLSEDGPGQGVTLCTDRGDLPAIVHEAASPRHGVIWVCGARGGFRGPGSGVYAELAEQLRDQGVTSLRLDYRHPNHLPECVLDTLAGVAYLQHLALPPVALVGHSFGGAVVISAGALSEHVAAVATLASQTYGTTLTPRLAPRPLLVVHGKADTRLPYSCSEQIYQRAGEPKQLVLYEGAEHRLEECRDELKRLLETWLSAVLGHSGHSPGG